MRSHLLLSRGFRGQGGIGGRFDSLAPLLGRDLTRNGLTDFLEAREVPQVREVAALLRLDGLNAAIVSIQELALAVGLFQQGEAFAVGPQSRVPFNKFSLIQSEVSRDAGDFRVRQSYLARPAAARRAALAFVENRHPRISNASRPGRKEKPRAVEADRGGTIAISFN